MSHLIHVYNCASLIGVTFVCFVLQSSCAIPSPAICLFQFLRRSIRYTFVLPQLLRLLFVDEKYWTLRFQMLSMQLICLPPLLMSIVAVIAPKRLDVSLFSKLYLSKLKTVVEQVQR
jgi:hypothetical protein